jgi:hypothetical protein
MTAEDVNELHEADGRRRSPPSATELEVARNGGRASVVCRSEHATNALVATPNASFHVTRAPEDERFGIERFKPASRAGYQRIVEQIDELDRFLHIPYNMLNRSVLDWMAEPRFRIVGVVRSVEDDRELFTVHFRNPTLDWRGGSLLEAGWFSVRPDDGWAIQEYELHGQSPEGLQAVWQVRAEYGVAQDGMPALDRVTVQMRGKTGVTRQITTKVKTLDFGPVPDSEFDLAAFGLEPPPGEVHQKSVWHRILRATGWTLTAVVLTLLLTVTMHFTTAGLIMHRRRHAVPPTNNAERSP